MQKARNPHFPDAAYQTIATLFLSATCPTAVQHEADNAFHALRRKLVGAGISPHDVADRIRGQERIAPRHEGAPFVAAMPPGTRRLLLDAIALRMPVSDWERRFLSDVRLRALSSLNRLSPAQWRTLQQLVDRAWQAGVRP